MNRRAHVRAMLAAVAVVISGVALPPSAAAAKPPGDARCAQWEAYNRASDGGLFRSEQHCNKYVRKGGSLSQLMFTSSYPAVGQPDIYFDLVASGTGLMPGSAIVITWVSNYPLSGDTERTGAVAGDGSGSATGTFRCQNTPEAPNLWVMFVATATTSGGATLSRTWDSFPC